MGSPCQDNGRAGQAHHRLRHLPDDHSPHPDQEARERARVPRDEPTAPDVPEHDPEASQIKSKGHVSGVGHGEADRGGRLLGQHRPARQAPYGDDQSALLIDPYAGIVSSHQYPQSSFCLSLWSLVVPRVGVVNDKVIPEVLALVVLKVLRC